MFSLPAVKIAAQLVASVGVSKILADVIKNNVNVLTRMDMVKVWTGSVVLGSMIVEQSSNHIDRVTNSVVEMVKEHKKEDKPDLKEVS